MALCPTFTVWILTTPGGGSVVSSKEKAVGVDEGMVKTFAHDKIFCLLMVKEGEEIFESVNVRELEDPCT